MEHQDQRAQTDEGLTSSTPPEQYKTVHQWALSATPELHALRRALREAITVEGRAARVDLAEVPEKMVLVASELATNAIEHGHPPTIVTLKTDGTRYLLDVADHDTASTPVLAGRRPPGAGGFGLQIARRLGQEVGWYTTGTTKHIWVTFSPHD